jgi:hypothetical protein
MMSVVRAVAVMEEKWIKELQLLTGNGEKRL